MFSYLPRRQTWKLTETKEWDWRIKMSSMYSLQGIYASQVTITSISINLSVNYESNLYHTAARERLNDEELSENPVVIYGWHKRKNYVTLKVETGVGRSRWITLPTRWLKLTLIYCRHPGETYKRQHLSPEGHRKIQSFRSFLQTIYFRFIFSPRLKLLVVKETADNEYNWLPISLWMIAENL